MNKHTLAILLQSMLILILIWFLWPALESRQVDFKEIKSELQEVQKTVQELSARMDTLERQTRKGLDSRIQLESRFFELQQQLLTPSSGFNNSKQRGKALDKVDSSEILNSSKVDDISIQQNLIQQGLPISTVSLIQDYIDRKRIQRLQLKNQAIRMRGLDSDEFIEKMFQSNDISNGIRREFGEKVYDHFLYANGRPNRIVVRETIPGSIAESAGIKPGDIVIRYANEPVFSMIDLRKASYRGLSGVSTLIELMRDNQPYAMTVPRGELGVLLDYTRLKP